MLIQPQGNRSSNVRTAINNALRRAPAVRHSALSLALALGLGLVASYALACNVPVFRYALDHWRPDAFRAVVISNAALTAEQQQTVEQLRQSIARQGSNVELQQLDASSDLSPVDRNLVRAIESFDEPQLMLLYPTTSGMEQPVWSARLNGPALEPLLASPVREELTRRLVAGQSTVWLLVDSSDDGQNQLATSVLESQLQSLTETLELPKLTDDPEDKIVGGPELRVEFSVLRVSRSDPREQALLAMLLGAEPDLLSLDEPMVFPVFGCGRAMLPLIGAGITPENIRETAVFLSGACSCQVKEQNPGFDLMISAKWNELMPWTAALPANKVDYNAPPQLVPIPTGASASPAPIELATTKTSVPESPESAETPESAPPIPQRSAPGAISPPLLFLSSLIVAFASLIANIIIHRS